MASNNSISLLPKTFAGIIIGSSVIALGNAAYLTQHAYKVQSASENSAFGSFCDVSSVFSCTEVLAHPAAWIFGVPFPLIALFVYPVLIGLGIAIFRGKTQYFLYTGILGVLGSLFNGYIILQEYLYIHAYCILCLICTDIIVTIAILSFVGYRYEKKYSENREVENGNQIS